MVFDEMNMDEDTSVEIYLGKNLCPACYARLENTIDWGKMILLTLKKDQNCLLCENPFDKRQGFFCRTHKRCIHTSGSQQCRKDKHEFFHTCFDHSSNLRY